MMIASGERLLSIKILPVRINNCDRFKKTKGDQAWVDIKISITQVARADFYITVKIISK
jgi:hypothetical protein